MPALGPVLGALILKKYDTKLKALFDYGGPLSTRGAPYTTQFCMAIGNGIVQGAPTIPFTTIDTGLAGTPPVPGVGAGVGIKVDAAWFTKELYTQIRAEVMTEYNRTLSEPWPPPADGAGQTLKALCEAIAEAVKEHYATAWILTSVHPIVYLGSGVINEGMFSGVVPGAVTGKITQFGPLFFTRGFGPGLAKVIGQVYSQAIMQHSTGNVTITGVCVPGPSQVCGLPIPGTGTGVAA